MVFNEGSVELKSFQVTATHSLTSTLFKNSSKTHTHTQASPSHKALSSSALLSPKFAGNPPPLLLLLLSSPLQNLISELGWFWV